jgi:hypothetical protein
MKTPPNDQPPLEGELILYRTANDAIRVEVLYESDTFWLDQKRIAELFGVELPTISYHLKEIYGSGELSREATLRKILRVQTEGAREVRREIEFYSLDAIISVGYRVNSAQATQFRIWATRTLREFVIKGFVLDDERLKLNQRFGKDYFDELLERIREIRASERRFYLRGICPFRFLPPLSKKPSSSTSPAKPPSSTTSAPRPSEPLRYSKSAVPP